MTSMTNETAAPAEASAHEAALQKFFGLRAEVIATMGARKPLSAAIEDLRPKIRRAQDELEAQRRYKTQVDPEQHARIDSEIAATERRLAGYLLANEALSAELADAQERCQDLANVAATMQAHLEELGLLQPGTF
jgi:chromosome segregation ATPase